MEEERISGRRVMFERPNFVTKEDMIYIRLKLYKFIGLPRQRSDPAKIWDYKTEVAERKVSFNFANFKRHLSNETETVKKALILGYLSDMGVPENQYAGILEQLFDVIKAAVSPENVIVVAAWDFIHRIGVSPEPSLVSATSLLIQQGTCCSICLEDFEQESLTWLPCTHHFHGQCIVQWLQISHLCPLCRTQCQNKPCCDLLAAST